jgi:biopolymer transport protein ExbD
VLVDIEGRFFIGNTEVPKKDLDSLKAAILQAAGSDRDRQVLLRADGRTPHQSVVTAMDALGQLGFVKLSIATTPEPKR